MWRGVGGDGHVVGVANGTRVKHERPGRGREQAVVHVGLGLAVAGVQDQLAVGVHLVHGGGVGREGLALLPKMGVERAQVLHAGGDDGAHLVLAELGHRGKLLELLLAHDAGDEAGDDRGAGEVAGLRVGHHAGMVLAELQEGFGVDGRLGLGDLGAVHPEHHLRLAVGGLVSLDRGAEVVGDVGGLGVHVVLHVGQVLGEGAPQVAVGFGAGEVLAVDPDEVDAAAVFGEAGLELAGELGQDVVDVHTHELKLDVVLLLEARGQGLGDELVARGAAAPAVPGDLAAAGGLDDGVPVGGVLAESVGGDGCAGCGDKRGSTGKLHKRATGELGGEHVQVLSVGAARVEETNRERVGVRHVHICMYAYMYMPYGRQAADDSGARLARACARCLDK